MTKQNFIVRFFSKTFEHLALQERINFARHLALVIKAGLPVFEGLKIIQDQAESPALRRVIASLIEDVNSGKFLADGLQEYEYLFGTFFVNIVRVGESSGTLSKNLLYLADELRRSKELQGKVRSAMVYPVVILIATLAVAGFLTFFIFPKLIPVFAGLNVQLPLTTRMLLATLAFVKSYGLYLLGFIILLLIGLRIALKQVVAVKYAFDRSLFFVPVLSDLVVNINMVNFTRVLGLLLKSGVKIVEALEITGNTFDNSVYRQLLRNSEEGIKQGGQLGVYLAQHKHFFPPLVSGMVRVGESTGNLEDNLAYLAEFYDGEVDSKLHALTSLIEPIMLLMMGLLVGFVALSIITPIYSISQGIQ
jgi:type II secretory pathway component PulF